MAAIDNLNSAVSNLESAAGAIVQAYKGADQSPAIQAVADRVVAVTAQLNDAVTPPPAS